MRGSYPLSEFEFIRGYTFGGKPFDLESNFTFSSLGVGACYAFDGYSEIAPALLDVVLMVFTQPSSEPAQLFDLSAHVP